MVSGSGVPGCGMAISEGAARALAAKFMVMLPHLDERQRRLYLGSEARALGHGGVPGGARGGGGGRPAGGWGGRGRGGGGGPAGAGPGGGGGGAEEAGRGDA